MIMQDLAEMYNRAEKLKDEGKTDEAIAQLEELLSHNETYSLAHSALAVLLGRADRHEEAIAHARRACELEPNDPFSFTALSVTYQRAFAGTGNTSYIGMAEEAMARSRMMGG